MAVRGLRILRRADLRGRIIIAWGVTLAVILLLLTVVTVSLVSTSRTVAEIQSIWQPAETTVEDLSRMQMAASANLADYVISQRQRSLTGFEESLALADQKLNSLQSGVGAQDLEIANLVQATRSAQSAWLAADATPTLAALDAENTRAAARATNRKAAWMAYDAMMASTDQLATAITARADVSYQARSSSTRILVTVLGIAALILLLLPLGALVALRRTVLNPLDALRADLQRAAAGEHTHPIWPHGPSELREVAVDAETLRRNLVEEIDTARAATRGLVQDAPIAAAMAQAVKPQPLPETPGLLVAGTSSTADGVVPGDWWEVIPGRNGVLHLVVVDVAGHGPEAAVVALQVRALIRGSLAVDGGLVSTIEQLVESGCCNELHTTLVIASINPQRNTVTWVNAGHPAPLAVTGAKDQWVLTQTGPLVSAIGGEWSVHSHSFNVDDVLIAFTDGLVERTGDHGSDVDATWLSTLVRGLDAPVRRDPFEVLRRVVDSIRARATDWHRDDATAVVVVRSNSAHGTMAR